MYPQIAREAPTIAFFIAANRESLESRACSSDDARRELEVLISSFVDDVPSDRIVKVYRCGMIGQPVGKLVDPNQIYPSRHSIESKAQGRKTVIVDQEFDPHGALTISGLADQLLQELGPTICSGRFSYDDGEYHPLTDAERRFIEDSTLL